MSSSLEEVAPRVVARVEAALRPKYVTILVRDLGGHRYVPFAEWPASRAFPLLPDDGKLPSLLHLLDRPFPADWSRPGGLERQLPSEEADLLRREQVGLLIPVVSRGDHLGAILVLGTKKSEEPYSAEETGYLELLARLLGGLPGGGAAPHGAKMEVAPADAPTQAAERIGECPQCGATYESVAGNCSRDGTPVILTTLPRRLAGRYLLQLRLGGGGMGVVYEALDEGLSRRVAVKIVRHQLLHHPEVVERFRREARIAAGFIHPNVVIVYDFGETGGGRAFLVMELLEGVTLRDEIARQRRLPPEEAIEILREVCAALDSAHRRGLVHRDLKPENIFLAQSEDRRTVKLLDLGIAKFITPAGRDFDTSVPEILGTIRYMAPEQISGGAPAPAWDLWALSIAAYEMITGAYPFTAATASEGIAAVMAGRFAPVSTYLAGAPPDLETFFRMTFAARSQRRPSSARALLAGFERAVAGLAGGAGPGFLCEER